MIFAIFIFLLQVCVFLLGLYTLACIYSTGEYQKDTEVGSPFKDFKLGFIARCISIFVVISIIWFFIFFNNLGDFITAATICEDYFQTKGFFSALCNTIVFHIGSVAFASAVLLPCSIVQFIYGPIYDLITKSPGETGPPTTLQRVLSIGCICLKWPYKKFIMRTGEQGFAMGYISCSNFCPSSKEGFYLLETYSETLGDVGLVNFLFRLTAILGITFLNTFIAILVYTKLPYYQRNLTSPVLPIFVCSSKTSGHFLLVFGGGQSDNQHSGLGHGRGSHLLSDPTGR